jgi:hypothetical protein
MTKRRLVDRFNSAHSLTGSLSQQSQPLVRIIEAQGARGSPAFELS